MLKRYYAITLLTSIFTTITTGNLIRSTNGAKAFSNPTGSKGQSWEKRPIHRSDDSSLHRKTNFYFYQPDINDPVSRHMGLRQPLPYEPQMGGVGKEAAILWKHHAGTFTALKVDFLNHHPGVDYGLEKLEDVLKRSLGQVHPIG